jgi:hypothetical protein
MPAEGNQIKIPLPFGEAIRLLGKVKPSAEMPAQGAHSQKVKAKKKARAKRAK